MFSARQKPLLCLLPLAPIALQIHPFPAHHFGGPEFGPVAFFGAMAFVGGVPSADLAVIGPRSSSSLANGCGHPRYGHAFEPQRITGYNWRNHCIGGS